MEKSKVSSGNSGGANTIDAKPQTSFNMNNLALDEKKKSKSKSGSGDIDEEIPMSENYDDDDFDMGSGLASDRLDKNGEKDFFNQNKNFTGHLGGFTDKDSKLNKDPSDQPSGSESGIGFKDNYDEDFF